MTFRGDISLQVFILSTYPLHSVGIYACILCFRTSLKWHIHVSAQTNATEINLPKALQIPYRTLLAIISFCPVVSKNLVMNQHLDGCSKIHWGSFLNLGDQAPALRDVHLAGHLYVLKPLEQFHCTNVLGTIGLLQPFLPWSEGGMGGAWKCIDVTA